MAPLTGIELGFYDLDFEGHPAIAQGGDTQLFHSDLVLFLKEGLGVYVSQNSTGAPGSGSLRDDLTKALAHRYLPPLTTPDTPVDAQTAKRDAAAVSGFYVSARGAMTSFLMLGTVIGQTKVSANPGGTLSVSAFRDPAGLKRFGEIGPYLRREVGGTDRLGFIVKDGKAQRFSLDGLSGIIVWDRAPGAISSAWLLPCLMIALAILLVSGLGWPVLALTRRYRAAFPLTGQRATAYRLVRVMALLALASVIGWLYVVSLISSPHGIEAVSKSGGLVIAFSTLTLLATVGGLSASVYNLAWTLTTTSGWFAKLWSVLLVFAFAIGLWTAWVAKLLSFHTDF